jgi:hypothetical protein
MRAPAGKDLHQTCIRWTHIDDSPSQCAVICKTTSDATWAPWTAVWPAGRLGLSVLEMTLLKVDNVKLPGSNFSGVLSKEFEPCVPVDCR